jgi:hypothetical protein
VVINGDRMEKSIRAREQRLERWHKVGQLMRTDIEVRKDTRLFYDSFSTDEHCPKCETLLEKQVTSGVHGVMRERKFCTSCKYSTAWLASSISEGLDRRTND